MITNVLPYIPTVLAWAAVVYELLAVRSGSRTSARQTFWLALLFLALALTVLLPPIALLIDQLSGIANVSRLLGHALVLSAAWSVQAFLFHLNYPDDRARWRIQRRGSVLAGTLAVMVALFALAPIHHEAPDFWRRYGSAPYILVYRLVFVAYLGLALVNVVRLCWRYAGLADHPSLSLGLRLVAVGAILGLAYCVHEGLRVASLALGMGDPFLDSDLVTELFITVGIGLMVIGATMPAWGPHLGIPALYRWMGRYHSYRRLYPLWLALYRAQPAIALFPPSLGLRDVLMIRDLDFRLYRRVVEIRDGCLALRRYMPPAIADDARCLCQEAGLSEEETLAVVEAASLAAAARAVQRGQDREWPLSGAGVPGGMDLGSEIAALIGVAHHYAHSPIVLAVLARVDGSDCVSKRVPIHRWIKPR